MYNIKVQRYRVLKSDVYILKATILKVTTMLSTSKNVLFPGHSHLLTTGTDDLTQARLITKVSGHQYQWLADGYDLEIGHF